MIADHLTKISKQEVSEEEKIQIIANFIAVKNSPRMKTFLSLDPAEYWALVQPPVYALNGSLNVQVKSGVNLPTVRATLKSGGNQNVKTEEFPSLSYLFQTASTGFIAGVC